MLGSKPLKPYQGLKMSMEAIAHVAGPGSKPLKPYQGFKSNNYMVAIVCY